MSSKFDHIVLGRAFRPHVLSTLKGLPGWPAYLASTPYAGRSQDMTNQAVKEACEALGLDLDALWLAFDGAPANAVLIAAGNAIDAIDNPTMNTGTNDMTINHTDNASEDAAIEGGAFEGRDVDALINEVLAPASAHMTPYLQTMLPGLIRPAIEAAVMGPRVITQTQTVREYVDADGAPVAPPASAAPVCNVVKQGSLGGAFGLRKSDAPAAYKHALETMQVSVCDYFDAPAIDPDYIWDAGVLAELAAQDIARLNAWIYGQAGTGKTEGARQYAARLKRPFVRIAIERTTEPAELIGQMMPTRNGGAVWQDGKLTRAFRIPHCVILIDEPTLLRSGTLAVLQTALDMRELYLVSGETVRAADGVFIIAADNTAGTGDDTGRYCDTAPLNAAFLDRFAFKTEVGFMAASREAIMIASRTGLHIEAVTPMVEYAGKTRGEADAGKLTMGVTTRRLLAWARTVKAGISSAKAFTSAIVTGAAPEDREVLNMLASTSLTTAHGRIDGIARGTIDPNAPVPDPVAQGPVSSTALHFPDDGAAA